MRILILLLLPIYLFSADWAQETLAEMSLEEKVGQLFIAGLYSNREYAEIEGQFEEPLEFIEKMIHDYHIGGVLFKYYWDPQGQKKTVEHLQSLSKSPLIIAQDLEWGLTMRHKNALRFPKNLTLGAIQDNDLIYQLGREIGRQCRAIGVNMNLSPVVDINTNPKNPVIGARSFGDDRENVTQKAIAMMRGLQDEGVIACAKHFPGHGDTAVDSHHDLPVLLHSKRRLQEIEFYPFKHMIDAGVMSVLTAHLLVPTLDPQLPSSLSHSVITGQLRNNLGFQGLIITDDLLMQAIEKDYSSGEAALKAFLAGNDLILTARSIPESYEAIYRSIKEGDISEEELDKRVYRILKAKEWVLNQSGKVPDLSTLFSNRAQNLKRRLYTEAITFYKGEALPVNAKSALLQIGGKPNEPFRHAIDHSHFIMGLAEEKIPEDDTIIVAFYLKSIPDTVTQFLHRLKKEGKKVVVVLFGSPYLISPLKEMDTIVIAYEDDPDAQEAAALVLTGHL